MTITEIDIHEAKKVIEQDDVILLDIRAPEAFEDAHIEKAVHIDQESIEEFITVTDKAKKIICCCYVGMSSLQAAAFLKEQGFENVFNLIGGFEEWRQHYPSHKDVT